MVGVYGWSRFDLDVYGCSGQVSGHERIPSRIAMRKRAFGNVVKLPPGNFLARWWQDGQLVTAPMTFMTENDARRFLVTVEADLIKGTRTRIHTGSPTLRDWAERWLSNPGKRTNAIARDRQGVHAFTQLLDMQLENISADDIQNAVTARSAAVEASTVRRDYSALRACLNAAFDRKRMPELSLPRRIGLPKVEKIAPPELTDDLLEAFVAKMPRRCGMVVQTAAVLGLRWGEVIGLGIRDIDFFAKTITVMQTVEEAGGHVQVVPWGKTPLPIFGLVAQVLGGRSHSSVAAGETRRGLSGMLASWARRSTPPRTARWTKTRRGASTRTSITMPTATRNAPSSAIHWRL